ncbi:MAG: NUDIX hydrolase [Patescibacteria group bacterium]
MIFLEKPEDFSPIMEASGCAMEYQGRVLLLFRHVSRPRPMTWGFPGGKLERGESPLDAVVREVREETGLIFGSEEFSFLTTFYVRWPEGDFIYHVFRLALQDLPMVRLCEGEHTEYRWATPDESKDLAVIKDGDHVIRYLADEQLLCTAS